MVSPKDSTCENQTGYSTKTSSYQSIDLCVLWEQSITSHLWGFLCIRDAGCRSNKITVMIMKFQQLCCSRTYPYNPHRRDLLYNPPPSRLDFPKKTPKCTPLPPLRNFQNFHTPPGIIAISYRSKKISSFVHYCRFCAFYVFSVKFYNRYVNSLCAKVMEKLLNRFLATHK